MMHDHFAHIFTPLKIANGVGFRADRLPRLLNHTYDRLLQLELWDCALRYESHQAYHNLAVLTDPLYIEECLRYAVEAHEFIAVLSLAARMRGPILHALECTKNCESCFAIRCKLIDFLELKQDWGYVRERIQEGRKRGLWKMWKPLFFFSPKADAITRRIDERVNQGWSRIFAAVCIVKMWRTWVQAQLHPDSNFIKKVQGRWNK